MSTETKVKCDRCEYEFIKESGEARCNMFFVRITLVLDTDGLTNYSMGADTGHQHWCQICCDQMGLKRPYAKVGEPTPEYPSLEDLIREIAREEAEDVATG